MYCTSQYSFDCSLCTFISRYLTITHFTCKYKDFLHSETIFVALNATLFDVKPTLSNKQNDC